jgi:hypothetical protein
MHTPVITMDQHMLLVRINRIMQELKPEADGLSVNRLADRLGQVLGAAAGSAAVNCP